MFRRITYVLLTLCSCISMWGQEPLEGVDSRVLIGDSIVREVLADSVVQEKVLSDSIVREVLEEALQVPGVGRAIDKADTILSAALPKVMMAPFKPDPLRSFWLSLILPGAGQIYNHKYWKLPVVYGGFLGCVYALSWNGQMLNDYTQAYLDIMDDDPNTQSYMKMLPMGYDITGREDRFKDIFKRKKNYYRKYRDMSIFAFAGVYLISVVDAYVDAELSSFDISRDLSLKWEPTKMNEDNMLARRFGVQTYGVQCSLAF